MKALVTLLMLFIALVPALAQHHNPKYDEWLRTQGPVLPPKLKRKTLGGAVACSFGVFSATATTKFGASPSGYASGDMENYGFGPAVSLALGNMYSPVLGDVDNRFIYGFAFTYGRGFGTASLKSYSQGRDGINGDRPFESLSNLESRPGYHAIGQHSRWNITFNLGSKFPLSPKLTMGILVGFGWDNWTAGADIKFQEFTAAGVVNRNLWGTYNGNSLSGNLESYLVYKDYLFTSLKTSGSYNIFAWMGSTTVVGASTVSLSIGTRLPFNSSN